MKKSSPNWRSCKEYIYVCMYVCIYVCMWEREREREKVCVYVCVLGAGCWMLRVGCGSSCLCEEMRKGDL